MKFSSLRALLLAAAMAVVASAGATEGAAVYAKCKACHGAKGEGNPAIAKAMKVEMKPLSSFSEDKIKAAVTRGAGKMKPVASVAGKDLDDVIAYVKTLR